jgi:flagellar biosynthesis chaperone FliJ
MAFQTNASERMRITSGGKVNINNTSNTNYQLYVDGGSNPAFAAYSTSANNQFKLAGTAPGLTISNTITSPTIGGALGACTSANDFITGTAAGDMILINQYTGNKLYITNYSGGVYLTQGATSWTANSDIRIKNINSHITNAVEKLSTLQTINFCYKDDISKKENLGLIAQEVEMVFPELIETNNDGILGVRYTELIPVLIEAIKEQQEQIKELKLELDKIKNK